MEAYVFEELLGQLLDVVEHFVDVVLLLADPPHLVGNELHKSEEESGQKHRNHFPTSDLPFYHSVRNSHHQTDLWLCTAGLALTQTAQMPCRPAPSSGSHPQRVIAGPGRQPGGEGEKCH